MNIHPFWYICISIRLLLILTIRYFYKNRLGKYLSLLVLISIGLGFLRKALIGSNNEIQIAKVFGMKQDMFMVYFIYYLLFIYIMIILKYHYYYFY